MPRPLQWLRLVLFPLAASGCSAILAQEVGGSYAVGKAGQSAVVGATYAGLGDGSDTGGVGGAAELRVKVGPEMGQVALGPSLYVLRGTEDQYPSAMWVLRGGFNLLQFESVEGRFGFGMFSPHLATGVSLRLHDSTRLFIMPEAEYDVRFTGQSGTGYVSLMIGIGTASYGSGSRQRPQPVR